MACAASLRFTVLLNIPPIVVYNRLYYQVLQYIKIEGHGDIDISKKAASQAISSNPDGHSLFWRAVLNPDNTVRT